MCIVVLPVGVGEVAPPGGLDCCCDDVSLLGGNDSSVSNSWADLCSLVISPQGIMTYTMGNLFPYVGFMVAEFEEVDQDGAGETPERHPRGRWWNHHPVGLRERLYIMRVGIA